MCAGGVRPKSLVAHLYHKTIFFRFPPTFQPRIFSRPGSSTRGYVYISHDFKFFPLPQDQLPRMMRLDFAKRAELCTLDDRRHAIRVSGRNVDGSSESFQEINCTRLWNVHYIIADGCDPNCNPCNFLYTCSSMKKLRFTKKRELSICLIVYPLLLTYDRYATFSLTRKCPSTR